MPKGIFQNVCSARKLIQFITMAIPRTSFIEGHKIINIHSRMPSDKFEQLDKSKIFSPLG